MSLTNEERKYILECYADGVSSKKLSEYYDISPHSVRRIASEAGIKKGERLAPIGRATSGRTGVAPSAPTVQLSGPAPISHLVIPDTQCKPGVDLEHLYWAGRYAAERQPDVVIHLGDHWDMASLSSYEKRGSRYFEGKRYADDIEAGNQGLRLFEAGMGGWQPKRKVLLRGNHEDRITRAINEDPRLEGTIGYHDFNDDELGWEVIDYLSPVTIDGVTYCHYFYHPNTGRAYSGSVDNMLRNVGYTFTMGHQQGKRMGSRELGNGKTQRGLVVGSFYQHNESYRGPQAQSEWRGLIVKHEVADGDYDLMEVSMNYLKKRFAA